MIYSLRVIYALDKKLTAIEKKYQKKLDKFYSDFEKSAINQATRLRDDKAKKSIALPQSKQSGLDNLLKQYFRDIEKAGTDSVKQDLLKHAKTEQEKNNVMDLKAPKSNKINNVWAERLAARQAAAFEKVVTESLKDAIKQKPDISANELKQIIRQKTEAYKNLRIDNTIQNESNRIQNQVRIEAYRNSGLVKSVIFVAVLDGRTTVNCRTKHNTVLDINDPRLSEYMVPQHPRCRSYLNYVLNGDKVKNTASAKINRLIKNNPIQPLKGMPRSA